MPNASAARAPRPPSAAPALRHAPTPRSLVNPVHRLQALADREMARLDPAATPAPGDRLSPRAALLAIALVSALAWAIPAAILI